MADGTVLPKQFHARPSPIMFKVRSVRPMSERSLCLPKPLKGTASHWTVRVPRPPPPLIAPPKVYLLLNHVNLTTKIREEEERGIVASYQLGKSEGAVQNLKD